MDVGVVVPVGPGREDNVLKVLESLAAQSVMPSIVTLICDGPEAHLEVEAGGFPVPLAILNAPEKHAPGMEQPRNIGVKLLQDLERESKGQVTVSHAWFLDTDVVVAPRALEKYEEAMEAEPINRVLIGPYDWMPPGATDPMLGLRNDPRWDLFDSHQSYEILREQLNVGLACFSGNLLWPIEEFTRVGGFWNELHHGRCEDGELGLRAVAMGVPMSVVAEARGWHIDHDRNLSRINELNAIDVPKINERHPWVEGEGLFVVEEDGKRFNVRCSSCGQEFNSGLIWTHERECKG